ncbi:MAG: hypothetical protein IT258_22560 [Saprospiraceae bacterium]|nr:hypothetical protein [Saprospiraceae bacterium]
MVRKKKWAQLYNQFDNATKSSKKKMRLIINDHCRRLESNKTGDPELEAMYDLTNPKRTAYDLKMKQWDSSKGIGKGMTKDWTNLLDEINDTVLDVWEGQVTYFFPMRTPTYIAIFPGGRMAITSGPYEDRLAALDALSETLDNYKDLENLKTTVDAKLVQVHQARNSQRSQYDKVGTTSTELEEMRVELANLLDDNLCKLKVKYRQTLAMVENFYDLSLLRKNVSDDDFMFQSEGTVEAGASFLITLPKKLLISTNATCNFINLSGLVDLQFFFVANGTNLDNLVKISVQPSETIETTAAEAGWAPGMGFLVVKNMGTMSAEFDLSIMAATVPEGEGG